MLEKEIDFKEITPKEYLDCMTELINRDAFLYRWYLNTENYIKKIEKGVEPSLEEKVAYKRTQNKFIGYSYFKTWVGPRLDFSKMENLKKVIEPNYREAKCTHLCVEYAIQYLNTGDNINRDKEIIARDINNFRKNYFKDTGHLEKSWADFEESWRNLDRRSWKARDLNALSWNKFERDLHSKVVEGGLLSKWDKSRLAFRRVRGKSNL